MADEESHVMLPPPPNVDLLHSWLNLLMGGVESLVKAKVEKPSTVAFCLQTLEDLSAHSEVNEFIAFVKQRYWWRDGPKYYANAKFLRFGPERWPSDERIRDHSFFGRYEAVRCDKPPPVDGKASMKVPAPESSPTIAPTQARTSSRLVKGPARPAKEPTKHTKVCF